MREPEDQGAKDHDAKNPDNEWVPIPLKRNSKLPYEVTRGMVEGFCLQEPIPDCAKRVGVSTKTVRATYHDLRARLIRPAFARWHPVGELNVDLSVQAAKDRLAKRQYLLLGRCFDHPTCWNNFVSGKRKTRQCRKCPLLPSFGLEETLRLLMIADSVRIFYSDMRWGRERGADQAGLMELRVLHNHVLITALHETPLNKDGTFNVESEEPLALGTLLLELIDHLEDHPL
ncbi:MAG: hypothetical protein AAFX52_13000 [Pseudomonadota bacterium]